MTTKALVALSGGQDSTLCLALAKAQYGEVAAITVNYGQTHTSEIEAAKTLVKKLDIKEHILVDLSGILQGTSPLLKESTSSLEQYVNSQQMSEVIKDRQELTFVPMRNDLFLTVMANMAFVRGINDLIIGVCQDDAANYDDCTVEYIQSKEDSINYALGTMKRSLPRMRVVAPLINLSKAEYIRMALSIPGAYEAWAFTQTSYKGDYPPLDRNHANVLREGAFLDANIPDPLVVRAVLEGLMEMPETPNYYICYNPTFVSSLRELTSRVGAI